MKSLDSPVGGEPSNSDQQPEDGSMLVLSRVAGEGVQVGPNLFIKVLSIRAGRVRLGFDAPRDIEIVRVDIKQNERNESNGDKTSP